MEYVQYSPYFNRCAYLLHYRLTACLTTATPVSAERPNQSKISLSYSYLLHLFDEYAYAHKICAQYDGWNQKDCECMINAATSGNANAYKHQADGSDEAGVFLIPSAYWSWYVYHCTFLVLRFLPGDVHC